MASFLTFIGVVNVLGAVMLMAATRPSVSDLLLRRWTRILPEHAVIRAGEGTSVWTWWAAIGTAGFAWVNLRAASMGGLFAVEIVRMDVAIYGAFEVLAVAGTISRRFGPGLWVCHPLWIGQGVWAAYVLWS